MLLTNLVLSFWLSALLVFDAAGIHAERPFSVQASLAVAQTIPITQTPQSPTKTHKPPPPAPTKTDLELQETKLVEAQRRTFAVSIIMSLADEARSHKNLALRARVLAWAADALWDADPDRGRAVLRQAWDSAEKADAVEDRTPLSNATPGMLIVLPRRGGGDSRSEVLNVASRRDRALAEEWLSRLIESAAKGVEQNARPVNDSWTTSDEMSKRLNFAHRLLSEKQADKAFEFAAQALNRVNEPAISFLSRLVELLEKALAEAQRIDADDHNRAYLIIGVAKQFLPADTVRSWEVAGEAVKAANATEGFSGDNKDLSVALVTRSGLKLIDLDTSILDLAALVRSLAEKDLSRANDLAKSFRYEAPRAIATLAVAKAAMEKTKFPQLKQ